MSVAVAYRLTGRGWSACEVEIAGQSALLTASYLSDALGDLLAAVAMLLRGVPHGTASFAEEPGEYQWRFQRVEPDRVSLTILWFDDWPTDANAPGGTPVLQAECRLRTLAGAILAASQQVLREYGTEGYQREWVNHPFPAELLAEVKTLLDQGAARRC